MKKIMISAGILILLAGMIWLSQWGFAKPGRGGIQVKEGSQMVSGHEDLRRVHLQAVLEREAYYLAKKEHKYEEAIAKFQEAMKPEYLNREGEKSGPISGIMGVHKMQGKYEEALKDLEWYMKRHPQQDSGKPPAWVEDKLELDALIDYQKTGKLAKVYEHIERLKNKWPELAKTQGEDIRTDTVIGQHGSTIIRLYDTIGDYGNGTKFVDEIIDGLKMEKGDHQKAISEYTAIRQAFESDKAQGKRGGPTKLIIESDNLTF